jgi:hypothetical protein
MPVGVRVCKTGLCAMSTHFGFRGNYQIGRSNSGAW